MNSKSFKKTVVLGLSGLILLIALIGYIKSDNVFYNNLLRSQKLSTPLQVFIWTINNYHIPHSQKVNHYASPRYLIQKQQWLWCDEAAIVMATLDHNLGYKTRLRDLYGYDNLPHHTILEVFEGNKWIIYDFTNRIHNQSIKKSSDVSSIKLKEARIKPYPKLYNALVNNNCFLKSLAFTLRGIKE